MSSSSGRVFSVDRDESRLPRFWTREVVVDRAESRLPRFWTPEDVDPRAESRLPRFCTRETSLFLPETLEDEFDCPLKDSKFLFTDENILLSIDDSTAL